jgi:RNA polymerase sigma-70 factor (ECF subfamily)
MRATPQGAIHVPDPVVSRKGERQTEDEALLADSVGLTLLMVLNTLARAEMPAFVLHDMFELPFSLQVCRDPA